MIYYMAAEHGVWAHELPLLSLPPQLGTEVLELFVLNIPHRLAVLQEIKRAAEEMAARDR